MIDDPARPEWTKAFFTGMPAPAGALTALLPLYASILGLPVNWYVAPFVALYLMGIAFLMVSTIPTFSGKNAGTRVPRTYVLPLFVLAVMFTALLASFTFEMLTIIAVVYLGTIPLSFLRHKTLKQEHERSMSLVPPLDNEPLREESAKDMSKSGLSDT